QSPKLEGRGFGAAAVHARLVVAQCGCAAVSRAIGGTLGQNDEPTIVQFRRALPERYFPADASLCIRIRDWRVRVQGPRDSWADPLRVAGVRACRIAAVSKVGWPWENPSHSSH